MKVIFRDRPFPVVDSSLPRNGMASPYFALPLHVIPVQAVVNSNIGRNGAERFNCIMLSRQMGQEAIGASFDLAAPALNYDDIFRHGLRRYDISCRYVTEGADLFTLQEGQRTRIRDWHAIDCYLLNGTLGFGRGFPEIHIGERVRLIKQGSPQTDQTFYVEQVSHNWQFGSSTKTSLGVTRGWVGDDQSYLNAVSSLVGKFTKPKLLQGTPGVPAKKWKEEEEAPFGFEV
jgi:hypothetical protein